MIKYSKILNFEMYKDLNKYAFFDGLIIYNDTTFEVVKSLDNLPRFRRLIHLKNNIVLGIEGYYHNETKFRSHNK